MKKIIAILLTAMMVIAMTACGNSNSGEKAVLSIATNAEFPPYEYYDDNNAVTGIDIEIAQAIADKLGMTLQVEDMAFDSVIAAVQTGKCTMGMAGITIMPDRQELVDFSNPYTTAVQAIIVKENSPITTVDDLFADHNYTVGAQTGTTGEIYATMDIEAPTDDDGNALPSLGKVERYNKGADAVQALLTGKIDCVIIDDAVAKNFVEANSGLKILNTAYTTEEYAIALKKGNDDLNKKITGALDALIADGTVQKIIDKYITAGTSTNAAA